MVMLTHARELVLRLHGLEAVQELPGVQLRALDHRQRGGRDVLAAFGILTNGASGCAGLFGLVFGK